MEHHSSRLQSMEMIQDLFSCVICGSKSYGQWFREDSYCWPTSIVMDV